MWISIERDSVRQVLRSPHCGVLSYLFDTTELIDCKYLNIVSYPVPEDPTAIALSSSSISLSWINTSSIYGISIERRTASTEFAEIARGTAGETSYTDEGLDPATQYFYRIRYYNGLEAYHPSGEDDATTEAGAVKYGRLYNWPAVVDARNFAAIGWTAPSNWTDWLTLINYLGGQGVAGGKIKEVGFTYWVSPNTGATNEVGFNARGSGTRFWDGEFGGIMYNSYFWSTEEASSDYANSPVLSCSEESFTYSQSLKYFGLPIRLVRPATEAEQLLADGTACDPYVGNDLRQYRTVKIGTQVWTADNLAETKFRNGDNIPIVTDNATWAALDTAGMCSYDNDDNNI